MYKIITVLILALSGFAWANDATPYAESQEHKAFVKEIQNPATYTNRQLKTELRRQMALALAHCSAKVVGRGVVRIGETYQIFATSSILRALHLEALNCQEAYTRWNDVDQELARRADLALDHKFSL